MKKTGFTLLEIVVAMGIFSIVILIALGVFISVMKVQKNTIPLQKQLTQTRTIVELLERELRTGEEFFLFSPSSTHPLCPQEAKEFCVFLRNQKDEQISFYLDGNGIFHRVHEETESKIISNEVLGNWNPDEKIFDSWNVLLSREGEKPEMITFVFTISSFRNKPLILQSTVTSRNYEDF